MTNEQVIGFVFLAPVFILFVAAVLTAKTDRERDIIAERHRKIARNGFKSRLGVK